MDDFDKADLSDHELDRADEHELDRADEHELERLDWAELHGYDRTFPTIEEAAREIGLEKEREANG